LQVIRTCRRRGRW